MYASKLLFSSGSVTTRSKCEINKQDNNIVMCDLIEKPICRQN